MSNRTDPRTVQTKTTIQSSLLSMLQEIPFSQVSVSELCNKCGINRGTFYLHYTNLWAVLEELETEALREEGKDKPYHCVLSDDHYQCPYGICDKLHAHPEYAVFFFDDTLTSHVIERIAAYSKEKYVDDLTRQCRLSRDEAETIFYFQLNGCLAINKQLYRHGGDWEASRDLIGGLIQGGLARYK